MTATSKWLLAIVAEKSVLIAHSFRWMGGIAGVGGRRDQRLNAGVGGVIGDDGGPSKDTTTVVTPDTFKRLCFTM